MLYILKGFSIVGKISIFIIISLCFMAIFAPLLAKHSWNTPSGQALEAPSKDHILGTDDLGIDLWAQICYGARNSILVGIGAALTSSTIGTFLGIVSGYYGGIPDLLITVLIDILMSIPSLPIMIVAGAFFGPSLKNIIIILAILSWVMPARLIRSKVLALKQETYIKVAKGYGANFLYITFKHFLPQIFPICATSFIKLISKAIVSEASLSFLGLGDPTSKSWGLILNHALNFRGIYFTNYWKWWVIYPLAFIICLVVATAVLSRELEKVFDTKIASGI
ncbi:MAG: ABC transporter permease [Thermoanaerobacteraceae bacterium]|nr:ABC transporter permease [Thermoanaerobacteraceae bacterium]